MGIYTRYFSTDSNGDGVADPGFASWLPGGLIEGIRIELLSGLSTVDVTISEPEGLQRTILAEADLIADETFRPNELIQDSAGDDVSGVYKPYHIVPTNLAITIANGTVSQTNKLKIVIHMIEDGR